MEVTESPDNLKLGLDGVQRKIMLMKETGKHQGGFGCQAKEIGFSCKKMQRPQKSYK